MFMRQNGYMFSFLCYESAKIRALADSRNTRKQGKFGGIRTFLDLMDSQQLTDPSGSLAHRRSRQTLPVRYARIPPNRRPRRVRYVRYNYLQGGPGAGRT